MKELLNNALPVCADRFIELLKASGKKAEELVLKAEFTDGDWVMAP